MTDSLSIALAYEWYQSYAGAERVNAQIIESYPKIDLFSLIDVMPEEERAFLKGKVVTTSFIQSLPFAGKYFRHYLPLMPYAIEAFDFSSYDIVISSSHAVAKGAITGPDQLHICYCHSPIRYAWDLQHEYLAGSGILSKLKGMAAHYLLHRIRNWDVVSANRPDRFIANSRFIARRIEKLYRRSADVIHPPVDVEQFTPAGTRDDYYVSACRLVPYKRVDVIARAFADMPDKKLVIIGDGPDRKKIEAIARGKANITMTGHVDAETLHHYVCHARAFIMMAKEDFGIAPVEAQACGVPVMAYGAGGALDTVIPLSQKNATGLFVHSQTPEALKEAVAQMESAGKKISSEACRENALRFSEERFRTALTDYIDKAWEVHQRP